MLRGVVVVTVLLGLSVPGCKDKNACIDACDAAFVRENEACERAGGGECGFAAHEHRWSCRSDCGVTGPKPERVAPLSPKPSASVAAPKQARARALDAVCEGKGEPTAAAWVDAKDTRNAAMVFYKTPGSDKFISQSLTPEFEELGMEGGALTDADKYNVVVCIEVKDQKTRKSCPYQGGRTMEIQDATFLVRVLEAQTAKVIASEDLVLANQLTTCPDIWSFSGGLSVSQPVFAPAVVALAKKHILAK